MKRGDLIRAIFPRELGKPRPALVVQSDKIDGLNSVLLCPLTTDLATRGPLRVEIDANQDTNLKDISLVMVDKLTAIPRDRCGAPFGRIDQQSLAQIGGILYALLGLDD